MERNLDKVQLVLVSFMQTGTFIIKLKEYDTAYELVSEFNEST